MARRINIYFIFNIFFPLRENLCCVVSEPAPVCRQRALRLPRRHVLMPWLGLELGISARLDARTLGRMFPPPRGESGKRWWGWQPTQPRTASRSHEDNTYTLGSFFEYKKLSSLLWGCMMGCTSESARGKLSALVRCTELIIIKVYTINLFYLE